MLDTIFLHRDKFDADHFADQAFEPIVRPINASESIHRLPASEALSHKTTSLFLWDHTMVQNYNRKYSAVAVRAEDGIAFATEPCSIVSRGILPYPRSKTTADEYLYNASTLRTSGIALAAATVIQGRYVDVEHSPMVAVGTSLSIFTRLEDKRLVLRDEQDDTPYTLDDLQPFRAEALTATTTRLHLLPLEWIASTAYSLGDLIRPEGSETVYKCTTDGTSGASAPVWDLAQDEIADGVTVLWTLVDKMTTAVDGVYDASSAKIYLTLPVETELASEIISADVVSTNGSVNLNALFISSGFPSTGKLNVTFTTATEYDVEFEDGNAEHLFTGTTTTLSSAYNKDALGLYYEFIVTLWSGAFQAGDTVSFVVRPSTSPLQISTASQNASLLTSHDAEASLMFFCFD